MSSSQKGILIQLSSAVVFLTILAAVVEAKKNYKRNYQVGEQGVFIDYDYPQSPLSHLSPFVPVSWIIVFS